MWIINSATLIPATAEKQSALITMIANPNGYEGFSIAYAATVSEGFSLFTIFVLACFVGYYVIWHVTPALHSPLMAITNAISSVIIIGAILAAGVASDPNAKLLGTIAVFLAAVNIFGGFLVTQRMLSLFRGKNQSAQQPRLTGFVSLFGWLRRKAPRPPTKPAPTTGKKATGTDIKPE